MKNFIKFPLLLLIVGLICGASLSIVYEIANPIIIERLSAESTKAISDIVSCKYALDKTSEQKEEDLLKYEVSTVYYVYNEQDELFAYAYQTTGKGFAGDIVLLTVISADGKTILGSKCLQESESRAGSLQDGTGLASAANLATDNVDAIDFKAGTTVTKNGVISAINKAVTYHKVVFVGEEPGPSGGDEPCLTKSEISSLGFPENIIVTEKSKEFFEKLGEKATTKAKNNGVLGFITLAEGETNKGFGLVMFCDYILFEGIHQTFKYVFCFDENGENSQLILLSSTDSFMGDPGNGKPNTGYSEGPDRDTEGLMNHKWLNQFNGLKMADLISNIDTLTESFGKISGATITTEKNFNKTVYGAVLAYSNYIK